MIKFKKGGIGVLYFILMFIMACGKQEKVKADFIYQYSIIDALVAGVYDGHLSLKTLKNNGDFGIGGFNQLDGELLMNNGVVYKARYDGSVVKMSDSTKTSIAFVKHFEADVTYTFNAIDMSYETMKKQLENRLKANSIYAIRITGVFKNLETRAPAPARKPYPSLTDHLKKHQYKFTHEVSEGIAVGFYMPLYLKGINVPGFHFHYISDDESVGGHILDFEYDHLIVEIDESPGIVIETINHTDFERVDFSKKRDAEVMNVERGSFKQ